MPTLNELSWEQRARAAEKTANVLADKVSALLNGAQTVHQKQLAKAQAREEKNRRRRAVIEARAAELQSHSQRLETEVAARTQQLRAILDNVTFGFLLLDRELIVEEGHTGSCTELLGTEDITGRSIGEVLGLNDREYGNYAAGLDQLFEDLLPEDVLVDQVVTRFERGDRVLRVDPRIVRGEDGTPERLLLSISDTTSLEAAQRRARTNAVLIEVLRGKDAFAGFIADVRTSLQDARDHAGEEAYVRRIVHTIKGNAATYGLEDIARAAHRIEERDQIREDALDDLEQRFRTFLETHVGILEMEYDHLGRGSFEVSRSRLDELRGIADASDDANLRRWTATVALRPAGLVLGPVGAFVERLAERLEKLVEFRAEGLDTLVDQDLLSPVFRTLTHLFRNAVDHGLEDGLERGSKPERGTIVLRVTEDEQHWYIDVEDDGRGIDVDALSRKAVASNRATPEQVASLDEREKVRLLFLDGVSSRDEVTDISGRGVGSSAVLTEVRRAGGHVEVETTCGHGTTFHLIVPKPDVLAARRDNAA